jgi:hypothetical protein
MLLATLSMVLVAAPDFTVMDEQVANEFARVERERREAAAEPPRSNSGTSRRCPGTTAFFVEWLLTHEPARFPQLLDWTRAHGAHDAVPDDAVPRLVSVELALQLAEASPADSDWLIAAASARQLDAEQRRRVFVGLRVLDRKRPGAQLKWMEHLDRRATCRYARDELTSKAARAAVAKLFTLPLSCEDL